MRSSLLVYHGVRYCENAEFAHGDVIMIGAYMALLAMTQAGLSPVIAGADRNRRMYRARCRDRENCI